MASRTMPAPLFVALLAAAAMAGATDLYQWKDAKGVTHYTDSPPPKGQFQSRSVVVPEGTPAPAPAATPAAAAPKPTTASANCSLAKSPMPASRCWSRRCSTASTAASRA